MVDHIGYFGIIVKIVYCVYFSCSGRRVRIVYDGEDFR